MLIDTHIHLDDQIYQKDLKLLLQKAEKLDIQAFINPGSTFSSNYEILKLTKIFPQIYPAMGVHPYEAESLNEEKFYELKKLCRENYPIAIGEIGLDFHYNFSGHVKQKEVFRDQLKLAEEFDLPVIIHSRKAEEEVVKILKEFKLKGVVHCFSSNWDTAQKFLDLDFFLGITGIITFPKAYDLQEALKKIPIEKILIETDGPYLAPAPYRGKPNLPEYLIYILEKIALIKNLSIIRLKEQIFRNTY
ncbi:MAG: TatD family hydrolase, partial [Armatimonadetes bacterium]|nr:TatD family hydrolase [Armatimonadota bacterium]